MNAKVKLAAKIGGGAAALVLTLVMQSEGYVPWVHRDPIGRLAVCYGHDDQSLKLGQKYTREQCEKLLTDDLVAHAEPVLRCAGSLDHLGPYRMAAAVSFTFNVGGANFCSSTFAKRLKANDPNACEELSRWIMAGGKDCRIESSNCRGIVTRRQIERDVCEGRV